MNIAQKFTAKLHDKLATFKWFERTITTVCLFIPIILRLTDKNAKGEPASSFRDSISDYVSMSHSYVFGMLLSITAMLFIFNGAVYFRNEGELQLNLNKYGKWYNVVLGISLLLVIILPDYQFEVSHDIFGGIFYLGNALVIGIFHKKKNRILSIALGVLTAVAVVISFLKVIPGFTLLWGEWISLTVIGIHFILESR